MKSDLLLTTDFICFTTRDYALANGQSLPSASRTLTRLAKLKVIIRVTKGIWANTKHPYFSPLGCVPLLLGPEQGYVSFLTALHRQGVISQIPPTIQVATTGHSRKRKTPVGTFEFFKMKPQMMIEGVQWSDARLPYRIATAEKALVDTLYLSTRRGKRFSALPELEFSFDKKRLLSLIKKQVQSKAITTAILERLKKLVEPFLITSMTPGAGVAY